MDVQVALAGGKSTTAERTEAAEAAETATGTAAAGRRQTDREVRRLVQYIVRPVQVLAARLGSSHGWPMG